MTPRSTRRPPYITATRSAICDATPKSWVTSTNEQPISSRRSRRTASTWAWTVTSSAVVGSSAITRSGLPATAIASITR